MVRRLAIYCGLALVAGILLWKFATPLSPITSMQTHLAWHEFPDSAPAAGEAAPNFNLENLDGSGKVRLSEFSGKPLVLVFGSYT